jgi:hypothetical protein
MNAWSGSRCRIRWRSGLKTGVTPMLEMCIPPRAASVTKNQHDRPNEADLGAAGLDGEQ